MNKKNVLITGGSGFIGSEVSKILLNKNYNLTILDIKKPNFTAKNLNFVKGSINNKKLIKKLIKKKNIVYHFAGIADIGEASKLPLQTVENNILATVNLLNESVKNNINRFIFASTVYVHSKEGGYYKCSKKSCEIYIQEFSKNTNLKFTILRYGTVYGPSTNLKNNINKIVGHAIKSKQIIYEGKANTKRRVIHAKDAAYAAVKVLEKKYENKSVLITGNKNFKIGEILKIIKKKLNIKNKIIYKNKNLYGHYVKSPFNDQTIPYVQLKPKKQIKVEQGIKEIINFLKKVNFNIKI